MRRGFILGKFLPPHAGHIFACRVGRRLVDELTVLVCSHDAEPIEGWRRADWMRECLGGHGFRIVHMHRDIPQEPQDHPDFWQIWKEAIVEHHPAPVHWVFGSEPYVLKLADVLDARPFMVDSDRRIVPVSGTDIRQSPQQHWAHIPPPVRPYFQKRVTLLGPESVGKTTLSERLAAQFQTLAIPEYGRDYDALLKQGSNWTESDFVEIARGHLAIAETASQAAGPIVVEDTDLLQTIVWAEALLGTVPNELTDLLKHLARPDLYLLLAPDVPWVDDGTRYYSSKDRRRWFHNRLKDWLARSGANRIEITGKHWPDRTQAAIDAVEALMGRS